MNEERIKGGGGGGGRGVEDRDKSLQYHKPSGERGKTRSLYVWHRST